jgi:hypothetical protein
MEKPDVVMLPQWQDQALRTATGDDEQKQCLARDANDCLGWHAPENNNRRFGLIGLFAFSLFHRLAADKASQKHPSGFPTSLGPVIGEAAAETHGGYSIAHPHFHSAECYA